MFSGFQNFERRDANGNGGVVGSDASSRTSNASEVFTDDAVVNPRRLLAVQCGRVPREGASPMAPKRCWFSPTAVVPPRPHQSLDSFFKTRRFITPPTANTSVLRHHSRCARCSDFRSRHQKKFRSKHLHKVAAAFQTTRRGTSQRAPQHAVRGFIGGQKRFNPRTCRWRRRPRLERTAMPSWARRRSAIRTTRPEISRERIGPRR